MTKTQIRSERADKELQKEYKELSWKRYFCCCKV